ncbi:hypothetical protein BH23PAT2_BH23PAT2_07720 [soil metagenome]
MRICSVANCENKHQSLGYCDKHYHQVRAHGKVGSSVIRRGVPKEKANSSEHNSYAGMLWRVKYHKSYQKIKVCERWESSFNAFLADMGEKPSSAHSLDRKDNNGDYTPENCRWATRATQARNRSTVIRIKYKGRTMSAAEWAREIGVMATTVRYRYHKGLPVEEILKEGVRHQKI